MTAGRRRGDVTVIQEVQRRKVRRDFRLQKTVAMRGDKRWGTPTSDKLNAPAMCPLASMY